MIEELRQAWARRRLLRAVRRRTVAPWSPDPAQRRVLCVLPTETEAAKAAWTFVLDLGLTPEQVVPVVPTGEIAYAPVQYIGRVHSLNAKDLTRLRLPNKAFRQRIWSLGPEVAFCLDPALDLAGALLVGASPARFRIGFFTEWAEPCFDVMVAAGTDLESGLRTLRRTLERIEPAVLALPASS